MAGREIDKHGALHLNETLEAFVTAPRAVRFFEGLLATVEGYVAADAIATEFLGDYYNEYKTPLGAEWCYAENGADYLDLIRDILLQALGRPDLRGG